MLLKHPCDHSLVPLLPRLRPPAPAVPEVGAEGDPELRAHEQPQAGPGQRLLELVRAS